MSSILDPTGRRSAEQAGLAPRNRGLKGATVGLMNSTKRNSDILLAAIGAELIERYGVKDVIECSKPTFSLPAPPPLVDELAAKCHFIVTGVGD